MKKAFTLIELLVVISIIGILVALSVFGLQSARQSARDAKRKADLEQIRSGLEIFKADCGRYLIGDYVGGGFPNPFTGVPPNDPYGPGCDPGVTYINDVPSDPTSPSSSYGYSSDGSTYILCAALERTPSPPMSGVALCNGKCGGSSCNYIVKNP